jgi:hypothetical protein
VSYDALMAENVPPSGALAKQKRTPPPAPPGRLWKPGQSGNPRGRPPKNFAIAELRAAALANVPAAIERLGRLIESKDEALAFQVIQFVYLYTFGKPQEGRDLAHLEAMRARMTELVAVPVFSEPETQEIPEEVSPLTPPETVPMPEATPAAAQLTRAAPPEATDEAASPVSVPSGLRCLYRGKNGQCSEMAADGVQWCAPHKAKLFSMVNP